MNEFTPPDEYPEALAAKYLPEGLRDACIVFDKQYFRWAGALLIAMGIFIGGTLTYFFHGIFNRHGIVVIVAVLAWLFIKWKLNKADAAFEQNVREAVDIASGSRSAD